MGVNKLLVIGLDGASFNILDPLIRQGALPNIAKLIATGARAPLYSTTPVATLPAWTSFLTGVHPATHGVSDIFARLENVEGLLPTSGAIRQVPTFLSMLSRFGLRVASLGVPGTYPPEEVKGLCVSGFDAPTPGQATGPAVYPQSYETLLKKHGGWRFGTFNEFKGSQQRERAIVDALCDDVARKENICLELLQENWDVFMVHWQASDTGAHHLWHTFDGSSPRAQQNPTDDLPRVYARLDEAVGKLCERADSDAHVMVVSDHGMGGASDVAVHLNRLLSELGYLRFGSPASHWMRGATQKMTRPMLAAIPISSLKSGLSRLPQKTQSALMAWARGMPHDIADNIAFSDELDYAPSIWIGNTERFPRGPISGQETLQVAQTICDKLMTLECPLSKRPLIRKVWRRHELPGGPCAQRLPDLIVEPAWPGGYRPSFLASHAPGPLVRLLRPEEFVPGKGQGMPGVHRRDGIFIMAGPGVFPAELEGFSIAQATHLVFTACGLKPPAHIEQCPRNVLVVSSAEDTLAATPSTPTPVEPSVLDNAVVTERLRALGYID